MPLEKGGRADKAGNRYEIKAIIDELLNLIKESNYSVVIEALGEDEEGTDILVAYSDGIKEHQQCKVRNASKEYWDIYDLKARSILKSWYHQLSREKNRQVALVSPIGCSFLVDLHQRVLNTSGNPRDFYDIQIQKSSKEFRKFYCDFCSEMQLDYTKEDDILKSIDFFKRIHFKQISEYEIRERVYQTIEFHFCSEKNLVYNALVAFVIDGDILGKEITAPVLLDYLSKQKLKLRLMDGDKRILPRIAAINREYRSGFKPLKGGLLQRNEFLECIDIINNGQNLVISGNAGYGKSGCSEAIIDYCENEKIPYIAIKLDRRIPKMNCEMWGQELGFPGSISYALHSVSKNQRAVIMLDQLDALRWTQANSSEALSVCMELIQQVKYLNYERNHKIIIVFICREYDLHNDNNIKALFKTESDVRQEENKWQKVIVQSFDEDVLRKVLGKAYAKLTAKTRQLLRIPSNLYIWQHLDEGETYDDCITTSHLIEKWYQQICRKSVSVGLQEKVVTETQEHIVETLDRIGRLYAPKGILNVVETGFDYLISAEMIVVNGNRVGFVHQSILDYFISKRMMQQYFSDKSMEDIIGEKKKQTPGKRYQIQMFLQNLLEYDSAIFVAAGKRMLESDGVRYYVKSVFYEILGQITRPDENLRKLIVEGCKHEIYADYYLNNAILGNHAYITILRETGILENWFEDEKRKNIVFHLFISISPALDSKDTAFIKERAFRSEEDDNRFAGCFLHDIKQDSDELFELRMLFYDKYPEWARNLYIDMKLMTENCKIRIVRLLSVYLRNGLESNGSNICHFEEELSEESSTFMVKNGRYILDELLQYVPKENSLEVKYGSWSGIYRHTRGIERAAVGLIKKANKSIIDQNPDLFLSYYEPYMGKNYMVFNEIILHGLQLLPSSHSNQVISYLSKDVDKKVFDYTSGANNQLGLATEVVKVHAGLCDSECLLDFEDAIRKYVSPRAVEWYKSRLEQNKAKEYSPVFWSFWGDMQYEILKSIPYERLSEQSKNLLRVLERRFEGRTNRYTNGNINMRSVVSPISGKKIGTRQWLQIITNGKLKSKKDSMCKKAEGKFIDSSLEAFSGEFSSAVKAEPELMIQLVLENKDNILPIYIDSMYSGAAFSENMNDISQKTWEEMFRVYPCDIESYRASCFCTILEKANFYAWPSDILSQLMEMAVNPGNKSGLIDSEKNVKVDSDELVSKSLNCVRGEAARAIGHLLYYNNELLSEFKMVIDNMVLDDDPAFNMASLYALWPAYNIDKEWAETRILCLYEADVRMAGFHGSREMFFRLYPQYRERVLGVIIQCFESKDKNLIQIGAYSVCEFYIWYGEFGQVILKIDELNEEQLKAILYMAVLYLESEEYREKAKELILVYKNSESDVEISLSGMFSDKLVDIERDLDFLLEIMKSKVNKRMVYSFVRFLEQNACSVRDYAEIILVLCESVLSMEPEAISRQYMIGDYVSKLIIALYDECANSEKEGNKQIAEKCLELWDIMFEKQIGQVRVLSRQLMER